MFRHPGWQMVMTALLTFFAGEFRIVPFSGEGFRFGLGASIFFLLILLARPAMHVRTSIVTGVTVVCLRILEDCMATGSEFSFPLSFQIQAPAFLFYFLFAVAMRVFHLDKYQFAPLRLGAYVTLIDFVVNNVEHLTRRALLGFSLIDPTDLVYFIAVAALRSYFIVGIYSSISLNHFHAVNIEQRKRIEQMMKVGSGLYAETLYLKKSMDNIEQITAQSYDLYRRLKEKEWSSPGRQALMIAQQIHEVKKDSQRILAGLLKLFDYETAAEMSLSELLGYVVESNRKYSEMMKQDVEFETVVKEDYRTKSFIPLLTIVGNLAANAVEAMHEGEKGKIQFEVSTLGEQTVLVVTDNGKGITPSDLQVIFEPGYTTKFNDEGVASTGIGLSHVQDIVHSLGGTIDAGSDQAKTWFRVQIPTKQLKVDA